MHKHFAYLDDQRKKFASFEGTKFLIEGDIVIPTNGQCGNVAFTAD